MFSVDAIPFAQKATKLAQPCCMLLGSHAYCLYYNYTFLCPHYVENIIMCLSHVYYLLVA